MKTFLKMLLASILGGIILFFIGFIVIASFISMVDKPPKMEANSVLKLDINNVIYERAQENPFEGINPLSGQPQSPQGLNKILASIKHAAKDDNIRGIYISGGIPMTGNATLKEIRNALAEFKESGKFVYAYSEIMSQNGYYLASVADSVMMLPEGYFEWRGLSATVAYLKEAVNKLGMEPVVLRATDNKYKSAVEPFLRQDMSPENRMQLAELLNSVWGDYTEVIGDSRNLTSERLNMLADSIALSSPKLAKENGFIDAVVYKSDILTLLAEKTGKSEIGDVEMISINKYAEINKLIKNKYGEDRIAVVIAQGDIVSGSAGEYQIGSDRIAKAIRQARTNDKVKAIVLRVNSPGGSAIASEAIWREVMLARETKPVVASMGDVAASGGYYISCFADTIVAQPNTVTGSIGAFGLFFTGQELMNDKMGINLETVKTNKYSDLGLFDRDISPSEKAILISQVDQVYRTFVSRVAEGRGMTFDEVNELGGGRVYSGEDAMELGLVDVMGGIDEAVAIAANMAGMGEEYEVMETPKLEDPLMQLIKQMGGDFEERLIRNRLGEYAKYFEMLESAKEMQGFQTRMEFNLEIE
jgi:protease-4